MLICLCDSRVFNILYVIVEANVKKVARLFQHTEFYIAYILIDRVFLNSISLENI